MFIIEFLLWTVTIPLCLGLLVFTSECFFGLKPIKPKSVTKTGRCAIVIPAHNEEITIGATLERLLTERAANVRVIVVADNCSDRTAEIARSHSCEVISREDPLRRGKGFALAFAADYLKANALDVVIVLDADSFISPGGIEALISQIMESGQAAQAINLQLDLSNSGHLVGISNFALLVKNLVRGRGLERLSGSSFLCGTGMALPGACFRSELLANENIVDDLAMTIDLAREGVSCHLVEQARVSSNSTNWAETMKQRTRWEHGYIVTGMGQALPLLIYAIRKRSRRLGFLALDLLVPPLALLLLLTLSLLVITLLWAIYSAHWLPATFLATGLGLSGIAVGAAWLAEGRNTLPWQSLIQFPIYALRKVPIYIGLIFKRQTDWTRTRRDGESPE